MTDAQRLQALERPLPGDPVLLDTDTFNEIDDQFALSYLVKLNKFDIKAFTAAPFFNDRSSSPEDGMLKSFEEIKRLQNFLGVDYPVFEGSRIYLSDEKTPVDSPAAHAIVDIVRGLPEGKRLYAVAIGAITNIASAILFDPSIIEKMTVVWLGGHSIDWPDTKEFNLWQDVAAARVILSSGVPFVHLPAMGVVSSFTACKYDLEHFFMGKGELAEYLCKNTIEYSDAHSSLPCWTKVIWDVTAIAWLDNPAFMRERLIPAPIPEYDGHYAFDPTRHLIKYVDFINRDLLFKDLIEKITGQPINK